MGKILVLRTVLLASLIVLLSSCTTTISTLTNEEKKYPQTENNNFIIVTNDKIDKPVTEIGYISTTQTNIETAKNILKDKAKKMGGEAILNFKITVIRQYVVIIVIPIAIDHYICRGNVVKFI